MVTMVVRYWVRSRSRITVHQSHSQDIVHVRMYTVCASNSHSLNHGVAQGNIFHVMFLESVIAGAKAAKPATSRLLRPNTARYRNLRSDTERQIELRYS